MTLLQVTPFTGRLSRAVRPTTSSMVLGGSVMAWVALSATWFPGDGDGPVGGGHAGHGGSSLPLPRSVMDPWDLAWVTTWLLMVVAMMWPLTVPTVAAVARSAFRGWRGRLGLVCLATVTVLWLGAGLAGATLAQLLSIPSGSVWWQLAFLCLALVAFGSARRRRLLESCLRLPVLAPGGRRGVETAVTAGVLTWRRCAVLCGPVMLAMTAGHSPALMLPASLAAWWEAWHPRAWRDPVPVMLVMAAAAGVVVTALMSEGVRHG